MLFDLILGLFNTTLPEFDRGSTAKIELSSPERTIKSVEVPAENELVVLTRHILDSEKDSWKRSIVSYANPPCRISIGSTTINLYSGFVVVDDGRQQRSYVKKMTSHQRVCKLIWERFSH
jgi:hypothetical protein